MVLPWELEDWLTDEGDRVVNAIADNGIDTLSPKELAVYEVWVLDTETRNGGVSQYFANRDRRHWSSLKKLAIANKIPSLRVFVDAVEKVIGESDDPYEAIFDSTVDLDGIYNQQQTLIVGELRELAS